MTNDTSHIIPELDDLMKLEHLVASRHLNLLPNQPVYSILAGKHASKLRGRGLDFEEARKYVAGDDIRNIDWRVTARTGSTYTKVFTEEKEKPVFVITDLTAGMYFGSVNYTKSLIASQLSAISAFRVLKNGDRFGGIVFSDDAIFSFAPQRSRKVALRYLKTLVEQGKQWMKNPADIKDKKTQLSHVLRQARSIATHDYLVVVISDFHNVNAENRQHLFNMSKHNDVILSQVTDPMEHTILGKKLVLSDGPMQLMWEANKEKWNNDYIKHYTQAQEQWVKDAEKHRIPLINFDTITPIEEQLMFLLKQKLAKR